ncbi:hypothetical protein [Nonomuraea gerenzanensis]|uniref:hypothetical protein n=1 Tax=Nonomuraea gerenzanensis TaxID=93944 RepID=UPI001CDA00F9|nr:hypothetical protein [Nonomuraea gerenzanensis]UBU16608.1 hypothetical protein LCN96_16800 [Nonomuraea gerenzanensis]
MKVIYRNRPAFFGYLVDFGDHQRELAGTDVVEPPRLLLEEYRKWQDDYLGWEYIALLDHTSVDRRRRLVENGKGTQKERLLHTCGSAN